LNVRCRIPRLLSSLLLIASLAAPLRAAAQEPDAGAYGTVGMEVSLFNDEPGLLVSFAGGFRREEISVGLKLYDLLNGPAIPGGDWSAGEDRHAKLHFAGLELAWTGGSNGQWRPGAALLVGVGDVSAYADVKSDAVDQSWFFVAQPTVSLGAPVDWSVLPRLDLGWRYLAGSRTSGTSDEELGGPSLGLSVRFPR
jgi:hypothetical protein